MVSLLVYIHIYPSSCSSQNIVLYILILVNISCVFLIIFFVEESVVFWKAYLHAITVHFRLPVCMNQAGPAGQAGHYIRVLKFILEMVGQIPCFKKI